MNRSTTLAEFINLLKGQDQSTFQKVIYSGESVIVLNKIVLEVAGVLENLNFLEYGIHIEGGEFSNLVFDNVQFKKLVINGGIFTKLEFRCCTFLEGIVIYGGTYNQKFRLHDPRTKSIRIAGGTFISDAAIYGNCENLEIKNAFFQKRMEVNHFAGGFIDVEDIAGKLQFNEIERGKTEIRINLSSPEVCQVFFPAILSEKPYTLQKLEIKDVHKNATIRVSNANVHNVIFNNASIQGTLFISETGTAYPDEKPVLEIRDSDLGSTNFINCDFEFHNLEFTNSKMTNIFISGTQFPDIKFINVSKPDPQDYDNRELNRREAISQLKKVYESKGDSILSSKYRAAELNSYNQTLKWNKKDFSEKIVLTLNKLSSNHGQNWVQALFTSLAVGLLVYALYCNSLGLSLFKISGPMREKLMYMFFEFMNPLHRADFIPERLSIETIPFQSIAIENLGRIFMGYCIYQFIQAFRKHGMK